MSEFMMLLTTVLVMFAIIVKTSNRIPKEGRSSIAKGETIEAKIVNENRIAEKAATMKLKDANGKKYRVKMRDSEAKIWIKGDTVKIVFSENKKEYRVLFNDYFRANEQRMREHAVETIKKKINPYFISARLSGYKKTSTEAFLNSGADSLTLFVFFTYMRRIDSYCIISAVLTFLFLGWYTTSAPSIMKAIFPLLMLVATYFVIYSSVMACKKMLDKFTK